MRMVVDSLDLVDLGEQLRVGRLRTHQQGRDEQQQRANRSRRHVPSFYSAPSYRRLAANTQTEDGRTSPGLQSRGLNCKLLICEFSVRWLLFYTGSHDYRSGYFSPRPGEVL